MPEIRPFRALRFDFARFGGDLSNVIAPPYDVLDQADKDALLARNSHNIVAIDLPHIPPKDEGPPEAYHNARSTLDTWLKQGVIVREGEPALYLYHQSFRHEGREVTRKQLITTLRLHDFGEGIVLPHEKTFGGPKADRLALTKQVRCNLSPVFGLFTDPDAAVEKAFTTVAKARPDAVATLDGVKDAVWVVTDPDIIRRVCTILATKKVFIADGHHRYTTALNYRDHLAATSGRLPADHPARYVMIVLASMDDPGCVIQGYSRVLVGEGVNAESLVSAWAQGAETCAEDNADLVLFDGATQEITCVRFTNRPILAALAPERHPTWHGLDVAYLHTYLIDKLATAQFPAGLEVRYVKSQAAARQMAEDTQGVAVFPKPTPMAQLRAVSEAGELMPQKSTYFFPKLSTGWTIHQLHSDE